MKCFGLGFNFRSENLIVFYILAPLASDPCNPSPCGPNAECNDGVCTCRSEYHGDPYFECRPECTTSSDCPMDKACVRQRCKNPCLNTCGTNAVCQVVSHMAVCTCPERTSGNAFIQCNPIKGSNLKSISKYNFLPILPSKFVFNTYNTLQILCFRVLVSQVRAVHTVNAENLMANRFARVCLDTEAHHHHVDQNAFQAPIVHSIKHVITKSA